MFGIPAAVAVSLGRDYFKGRNPKNPGTKRHKSKNNNVVVKNEESSAFERGEEIPQVKERLEQTVPWIVTDEEEEEAIQN